MENARWRWLFTKNGQVMHPPEVEELPNPAHVHLAPVESWKSRGSNKNNNILKHFDVHRGSIPIFHPSNRHSLDPTSLSWAPGLAPWPVRKLRREGSSKIGFGCLSSGQESWCRIVLQAYFVVLPRYIYQLQFPFLETIFKGRSLITINPCKSCRTSMIKRTSHSHPFTKTSPVPW